MPGTLFIVATPIGNLEDVTLRALRVLREARLVAAEDTRRTAKLLSHYGVATPTTSFHAHNERQKLPALVARLKAGEAVALVSDAGTPGVSDPGQRLVQAARAEGVRVEVVPGASAVLTALVATGVPFAAFTFLGFPPTRAKDRQSWFSLLGAYRHPIVFFEAPHRIRRTLSEARAVLGDRPIHVARELTKVHEEVVTGSITYVLERLPAPRGEFTVVLPPGEPASTEPRAVPDPATLWAEFCHMTQERGHTRRQAVFRLARRHGVGSRVMYRLIEQAKDMGPMP